MLATRRPSAASSAVLAWSRAPIIGLDIGAHEAKVVVRQPRRHTQAVVAASRCRISWDAFTSPETLLSGLTPLFEDLACGTTRDVVCSFPSTMVDYEAIDIEASQEPQIPALAEQLVGNLLGPSRNDAISDYWYSPRPGLVTSQYRLHIAWMNREFAEGFSDGMSRRGFRCRAIDAAPLALARAAQFVGSAHPGVGQTPFAVPQSLVGRGEGTLVVDIGAGEVSLVAVADGAISYLRNRVRFATGSAIDEFAQATELRGEVAELLLSRWGLGSEAGGTPSSLELEVQSVLGGWLEQLRREIQRTLTFVEMGQTALPIARLVLCGGGACLQGIAGWLERSLGVPAAVAGIPEDCDWQSAEACSPVFAQALALTQHGELL